MATRYISYDIDKENDYEELYDFLEVEGAQKLSESFYKIESSLELKEFCNKLKRLTNDGDIVIVIFNSKEGIKHKYIRI